MHHLSIAEIRHGDVIAITEHYLARIARYNGELQAFTALDIAGARAAAAASAERIANDQARALEGVPLAIKANIAIAGLATTAGVEARRNAIATTDAAVVTLLRDAGAVILGHVNLHEAALGATTDNPAYGRTQNPHKPAHSPGGSSGGSAAAVAAGLCAAALGTDTLGSIRIPAAYCGVYGLKPTNGLVPDAGLTFLARRLDTVGPLARSIADLAALMAVLAPLAEAQPVTNVATLAAVDTAEQEPMVRAGFEAAKAALCALGIEVIQAPTPDLDLTAARMGGFIESAREAAHTFAADRAAGGISPHFAAMLDFGAGASDAAIAMGASAMANAAQTLNRCLDHADILLLPTSPQAAFPHGRAPVTQADFTALANLAGLPALALPSSTTAGGLPVGVQLIGRPGSEATLLALAARLDDGLRAYRLPPAFT